MGTRGRKAEVELVELEGWAEPGDDDSGLPPDAPDPRDRARGWRRVRRAWPVALLAVVVGGAFLVVGARDRAALEARHAVLAGQTAYVADLRPGLEVTWSIEASSTWAHAEVEGDAVLVVLSDDNENSEEVVVDLATGEELWRPDSQASGLLSCHLGRELYDRPEGTFACVERREDEEGYAFRHRDARTGELVFEHSLPVDKRSVWPWGEDLLYVDSADGSTSVVLEAADGTLRSSVPLLDRPLGAEEYVDLRVSHDRALVTAGDRAVVIDPDGHLVLDVTAGSLSEHAYAIAELATMPRLQLVALPRGGFAVTSLSGSTTPVFVYDEDGELAYERDLDSGHLYQLELSLLDDGTADVLVWPTSEGAVVADRATGEELATLPLDPGGAQLVLDGALVYEAGGRLRAVDALTGEERWSHASAGAALGSDGAVVVTLETDVDAAWVLARDLATGDEAWRVDLGGAEAQVITAGGHLFVHDGGRFSRLGR